MKKLVFGLLAFTLFAFVSCNKESHDKDGDIISELARTEYFVEVNNTEYERVVTESLNQPDKNSPYTAGVIEYKENGDLVCSVDFGKGGQGKAEYKGKGGDKVVDLKKGEKYKKVIIEPLVKADNCQYIVAGIVKFYDTKTDEWLATFDYGDGTCDEFILKTTADGNHTFSMNEYPEWK